MTITEAAPAKINLALHIRARRPDGYHDLETLFAFAHDGDLVSVTPAAADGFTIRGRFAAALGAAADGSVPAGSNLVTRARDAFRAAFGLPPVAIALDKRLPIAAGIGGGSADAAATLRALARMREVDPADARLDAIARGLGADVPACLLGCTAFATGRGDDLQPLPLLGDRPLLLVNPGVPLSTAAMFAAWDGIDRGPIAAAGSPLDRAAAGRNDFGPAAIAHAPAIATVLDTLSRAPGACLVRLSGSGATCFALYDTIAERDAAAAAFAGSGCWTLATFAR